MEQPLLFMKMEGAGNDFVVLDNRRNAYSIEKLAEWAPELCDRRRGIGADGLLALQSTEVEGTDYAMVYRNADGSDAGMCGNGARCLVLYASSLGLGKQFSFSVHDAVYRGRVLDNGSVGITFPQTTQVESIPSDTYSRVLQVFAGTQHIVIPVQEEALEKEELLRSEGRRLRYSDAFDPPGTNVNFFCAEGGRALKLRTYEKGVEDLTLACGTGAIATALAWHHLHEESNERTIAVESPGGTLTVEFEYNPTTGEYSSLTLEGPAHFVFEGKYIR